MKEIYVLRHGEKSGDELTEYGKSQAIDLKNKIGPFALVLSSEKNRTKQTAELVSGKQAETDRRANVPDFPSASMDSLQSLQQIHPLGIIGAIWENPELIEIAKRAGAKMEGLITETLARLSENEKALIVSHDGTMIGLEKILNGQDFDRVDHSFGSLEGFIVHDNLHTSSFSPKNL